MILRRQVKQFYLISSLFILTGCMLGPDFVRPEPPPVQNYSSEPTPTTTIEAGGVAQHFD